MSDTPRVLEPFVAPCFELGAEWYSYDNGMTWCRIPPPEPPADESRSTMTVIGVYPKTGTITIKVECG